MAQLTLSGGRTVSYHDSGSGKALFFLHSFGHNKNLWYPQLSHFAGRGYRVIAPDMPGHGESSFDPANHTVDSIAETSIELLDKLGVNKAVVAGISIGGYILLKMMARRPDLFEGMVMICTKAEADTDEIKARRRAQIENIRTNGLRAFVELTAPKRVGPRVVTERPWVVDWIKLMNYTVSAEANAATLEAMALKADDSATLPKITVPALVLSGSDDIFIPKDSPYNLEKGIKNSVHHVIEGAGHVASLEFPDEVNRHMETFLNTL